MGVDNCETCVEATLDKAEVEPLDAIATLTDDEQRLLKYSLFAADESCSDDYPLDIDDVFLEELGRPYKAVWFSYNFHDVGPKSSVEECTEMLAVGVVNVVFSPDVVHRLELFLLSFKTSLEAIPLISQGRYVHTCTYVHGVRGFIPLVQC